MGCIEPHNEPGDCPICGMKLIEVENKEKHSKENKHHGQNEKDFLKKFFISLILTIPIILYSDIFQELTKIYLPKFAYHEYFILLLGSIVFFYGGGIFLKGAYLEIKSKNLGMMTLIGIAISSAYFYSVLVTFLKIGHEFFWELASLITVMLLGHYLEMKSISSAKKTLEEIKKLLPDKAEVIQNGKIKEVSLSELKVNDLVLVRPGGKIPADGVVIEGESEVNENMITGETRPVFKEKGSEVIAGTINGEGMLKIKITKVGEQTFLAGIKRLIKEAESSKSKLQLLADTFARYLTFIALFIGGLSFIFCLIFKKDLAFALERLVTVLVIACPHALGLAIPLVIAISTSLAVRNGFLIKNRLEWELTKKIDVVLFDKTGTLTKGKFKVTKIIVESNKHNKNSLLQISASLNQYSQHFIAQGILEKAREEKIELLPVEDFKNLTGRGVQGKIEGQTYFLGGENLLKELKINFQIETTGTNIYLIDENKNILGTIVLEDEIKKEAKTAVDELHKMKIKTLMITGDKKEVAKKVAEKLNLDEYFAEFLPEEKVNKVKELQNKGLKVMMVGDGINDAPALMQADVGVAIGAGTNLAIESAGIILIKNNLLDILKILKLSKATYQKMIQNLFWASGYNIIALPLAGGILAFKGIIFSPALGAILMSLSTIIVALNAVSLRSIKLN